MERQEAEARRKEILRQMGRLANDLEELEDKVPDEGAQRVKEDLFDLYVPRGLRNIHRLPKPML
jgi:hypothetical protein